MIDKIGIRKLRALWDTGMVDIKPLTIAVGKNSCGKSTWLRTFPLLEQTFLNKTSEPILWFERSLVDFGSFEESYSKFKRMDELQSIDFSFEISFNRTIGIEQFWPWRMETESTDTTSRLKITKYIGKDKLLSQKINIFGYEINIDLRNYKVNINVDSKESTFDFSKRENRNFFISTIMLENTKENRTLLRHFALNKLYDFVKQNVDKRIQIENLSKELSRLTLVDKISFKRQLEDLKQRAKMSSFQKFYSKLLENEEFLDEFLSLFVFATLDKINSIERDELQNFYSNVNYIAPVRASAERYYRKQGLSVEKIDSQGVNVPLYLYDLKRRSKKSYNEWQEWTEKYFQLKFDVADSSGHISLFFLDEKSNSKYNLSDTGFGFSQILPILLTLWRSTKSNGAERRIPFVKKSPSVIVIEQPELHLHPAMQAQLIRAFLEVIEYSETKGLDIRIIIETHSETIIKALGRFLSFKENDLYKDVNVLVFNSENPEKSNITVSSFGKDGFLENWPYGFFDADID
ncbi:AAA family ATPase [Streptococcus ruminantium]|uniref:AAA family ATPase n=1 Tax=Streptococcus ruminantium TaxID=1917441 RepID=UPI0012DF8831|nr:AAA family ATPase [Streptococcus ruminantium]